MMVRWISAGALLLLSASAWAISPYIQGDSAPGGNVQAVASAVEARLKAGGFKVVGKYFPQHLAGYGVVIATDDAMLDAVGEVGGPAVLGAAIRVGVKADGSVMYTNPDYWYRAYFRRSFAKKEAAVQALQGRLRDALGAGAGVGGDESAANLANYRYMVGMERLDSPNNKLAEHASFADAVKAVRENLAKGAGKTSKVYEVVMPGRKLAVFGVAMSGGAHGDGQWISKIDMQDSIAGLPYEVYVVGNEVGSPHGRFRIALAFPDVGMGQFMRISSLPNAIMESMGAVAGVDKKSSGESWH
ncbi:MAG TPA: hypothetical protein VGD18_06415 [Thiobacillaceae bacterium]